MILARWKRAPRGARFQRAHSQVFNVLIPGIAALSVLAGRVSPAQGNPRLTDDAESEVSFSRDVPSAFQKTLKIRVITRRGFRLGDTELEMH